ncbi:hypothetical protein [uncultured Planktosalinus sp.]|uniref:hypothetical protein n=1 Tax=uncultured Planktosalinus sp. TaxID=1810935 RepID=UPI0030D7AA3B
MDLKKTSIGLFIFIAFSSCQSQNNNIIEEKLKKCVNEVVNATIVDLESYDKNPFDFYDFILDIEQKMLDSKMLQENNKNSYLNVFKNIQSETIDFNKEYTNIIEMIEDKGFDFNSYRINDGVFNQCPHKVSVDTKEREGKLIYKQGAILNKMMEQGYNNKTLLSDLMEVTNEKEFGQIIYRAPVILLVMINLDNKYNPTIKEREEFKKGKTFLGKDKG